MVMTMAMMVISMMMTMMMMMMMMMMVVVVMVVSDIHSNVGKTKRGEGYEILVMQFINKINDYNIIYF